MRKVCVVTGTRAEYGLLSGLLHEIQADSGMELQLIVTGMHLSHEYGLTWKKIEQEGFQASKKIEMLLASDTSVGITKSMGVGLISFADALDDLRPEIMVLLGDRFESFVAASAAMIAKIPIAHIHGGEITEGAFDDAIRHSITKMSHLHFTANEEYRRRVIQLGECPERVYSFGGLGVDLIKRLDLLGKMNLEKELGIQFQAKNLLITYHPVTLEENSSEIQFRALLSSLNGLKDTKLIFTKANADPEGKVINLLIDQFVSRNASNASVFTSMGQTLYLSTMKYVDAVVGNSSSGILEAPSFNIGTINIGDRQKGRIKAESIIDCHPNVESISKALEILYSPKFQSIIKNTKNPYGEGGAAKKIKHVLKNQGLKNLLKKTFNTITAEST